jgi:hypothetical protein
MLYKFIRRPKKSHLNRNSFSFGTVEVSNICFNDDIEITVYDETNQVVGVHRLSGFVFLNSLVKKKLDNGIEFMVIKI